MAFVYVEGGCYQMGCENNTVLADNDVPNQRKTDPSVSNIPVWQWPLAVVAALLPVSCVYGKSYYVRDGCPANEMPAHEVCVDSFWMGKYEVTQYEYWKITRIPHSYSKHDKEGKHPKTYLSWDAVQDFISKFSHRSQITFRLPTEAEWEYAARSGGKMERYAGGNSVGSLGWYFNNSGQNPQQVGKKSPNGLGIYDMSGNVWELCSDWYKSTYYKSSPKNNPQGPLSGTHHLYRGGSWGDDPGHLQTVYRHSPLHPEYVGAKRGFRLVFTEDDIVNGVGPSYSTE